jgi:hypothetical protein
VISRRRYHFLAATPSLVLSSIASANSFNSFFSLAFSSSSELAAFPLLAVGLYSNLGEFRGSGHPVGADR